MAVKPETRADEVQHALAVEAPIEVVGRPNLTWPIAPPRVGDGGSRLRRRIEVAAAAVLVLAVAGTALWVVRGALFGGPPAYPALVEPPSFSYLQFATEGQIQSVSAAQGASVRAGQVLATQNITTDELRLTYDEATLAADQATLTALPGARSALATSLSLEVTLAQQELSGAEAQLGDATTPQAQTAARAAVGAAQTRVALAENALASGSSSGLSTQVAAAEASVARDQTAIAADRQAIQDSSILAPRNGRIALVGGTVGDLAGPSGVSSGLVSGTQVPSPAGFSLFPPAPQAPAVSGTPSSSPMFVFYPSGDWLTVASVPQSEIFSIRLGERARVTVSGRSGQIPAVVTRIDSAPVYANGAANYDVVLSLTRSLGFALMGLSASVAFLPGR